MQYLLTNWKTTSTGLTMISLGVIHLVFCLKSKTASEEVWAATIAAVVGGLGLIFARDAGSSAKTVTDLQGQIDTLHQAVKTGDTSILTKPKGQ